MLLMLALAIVNLISECNVKDCSLWSIDQTRVNEAWVILVTCFLVCYDLMSKTEWNDAEYGSSS